MKPTIIFALFISLSPAAFATSFDCTKASTSVEKMICNNPLLSKLDDALAKNYTDQVGNAQSARERTGFQQEQKVWIRERNSCADEACLVKLYSNRVDQLCPGGIKDDCIPSSKVLKQVDSSLAKPVPVNPTGTPTPASPKAESTQSKNLAPAGSAADATNRRASEIKALGFSDAFLKATIYLQADMYNRPKAWMTMEAWLGKLFESGNYASITRITSGKSQGVMLKRQGVQSGGILFVLDGGELFPSHSASSGKAEVIESVGEQVTVAMAIAQSIK